MEAAPALEAARETEDKQILQKVGNEKLFEKRLDQDASEYKGAFLYAKN